jgi:peptide/nickel transport system substrate-binding protein
MRFSTRGALIALLVAATAAGCGGGSPAQRAPSAPAEFIDVVAALPRSLDPAAPQDTATGAIETSLAGTLVRPAGRPPGAATLAPATELTGFLASSWRRLAGGDYLFTLRPGVRSAYGHTLSGADVNFSFRRELALSAPARALATLARISLRDPTTVLGPRSVRLNVTAPSPFALAVLGDFHFGVLDARAVAAHESAADRSARGWLAGHLAFYGAWELLGFDPGGRLLLRANPSFWRPLHFGLVAIEAAAAPALRLGDVAAAEASHTAGLDWPDFAIAAHTSGLRAATLASTAVSTLVPDERNAALANVLVRRALSLALDRTAIARSAFGGFALPARHPFASTFAAVPGVREPAYGHSVALARRLLARAGYPRGFRMLLASCAPEGPPAQLRAIVAQLRAISVSVRVRRVASCADLAGLARSGAVAAVLETAVAPLASAAFTIAADYLRDSPANVEGYDSAALARLAGALTGSGSAAASAGVLARALAIVADSFPVIPLVELPGQLVTRAAIGGYAAYPAEVVYYDELSG